MAQIGSQWPSHTDASDSPASNIDGPFLLGPSGPDQSSTSIETIVSGAGASSEPPAVRLVAHIDPSAAAFLKGRQDLVEPLQGLERSVSAHADLDEPSLSIYSFEDEVTGERHELTVYVHQSGLSFEEREELANALMDQLDEDIQDVLLVDVIPE